MNRVVALDGHNLALQRGTGVATYAKSLADNIGELGWETWTLYGAPISSSQSPMLREISFYDYLGGATEKRGLLNNAYRDTKEFVQAPFGYRAVEIPQSGVVEVRRFSTQLPKNSRIFNVNDLFLTARRYFKRHKRFLTIRFEEKPDVMHWTYPLPVRVEGVPNVYTIHDLVPLRLPYTTLDNKRYYHRLIKGCIEFGDHICTVSEKSKEDILSLFNVAPERLTNTYQSVNTAHLSNLRSTHEAEQEVEGIYGLRPYSYFLFYGAIEPKKNVGRLIEAFLSSKVDAKLVIVGSLAWKSNEEMRLFESMVKSDVAIAENIKVFDYAPRPFLMSLIRCAKAVVFPSLYEGFGLPLLEAMQLGVPTLCSSEGALPEIAEQASLAVDPYDVVQIARGLKSLDSDADLRDQLVRSGLEQAKKFDATAYKKKLVNMYDALA
ncbi:glycosyltransferase family 4 protein [Burkholderia sp. PAMC 26561]|uniref:glycosyltransferase family 4 protein n=1 Tax=Burkholderia sp. PAMC 26561 TaxID=1795043 RepID=UPI00076B5192|nr:glycosyltransferase family 1 protein [Burkholderia sp. PAMC 26561]AME22895.1 glycosyl transferase family 1 [Burkholderia sp. PAMC 26561]